MLAIVSIFSFKDQIARVIADEVSDQDTVDVTAVVPSANPPDSDGGGSSGSVIGATVRISGYSFPNAKIRVLKDGQVATTLVANTDGTFTIVANGLRFGTYQFSIYAEDRDGVVSSPHVINATVIENRVYYHDAIIIPPTISTNLTTVGPNQNLVVFGYAPIGSNVLISVPDLYFLGSAIADQSGFYRYELQNNLPSGLYQIRSRAQLGASQSMYSRPVAVQFYVGQVVPPPPGQLQSCADFNGDQRINLVDFSILLFWFGKTDFPDRIDCNGDRAINIKDFSILMFFWTG